MKTAYPHERASHVGEPDHDGGVPEAPPVGVNGREEDEDHDEGEQELQPESLPLRDDLRDRGGAQVPRVAGRRRSEGKKRKM